MKRIKVAVVGAGRLGGFHAQKFAAHEHVDLVGVADPDRETCESVACQCKTLAFADHAKLLDCVDAAVIAAPTRFHRELALDFLRRGVHVLVEKPLCATADDADALVQAARQNNAVLQVGHVERFNPAFNAALAHVENPKYIEATRAGGFTFRSTDIGVVLDLMVHDIDLVLSMVHSEVRKVDAVGFSVLGGHEDVANARIEFESGCVATLSASRVSPVASRRMQVWGPRAFADIDFAEPTASVVRPSETLLRRQFNVDALSPGEQKYYRENFTAEHLPGEHMRFAAVDALALEVDDFVDSIRRGRAPRVSGEAGHNAVAVAEYILAKINVHAWDDATDGLVGAMGVPSQRAVPAPHFTLTPAETREFRREAG